MFGVWKKEDWIFSSTYKENDTKLPINDKLITYMSKGILLPSFVIGFTEDAIQQLTNQWVVYEVKKTIKPTYDALIKETIAIAPFGKVPPIEIFNNLITVLNKHKIVCGRYKVRDMYDTIIRMNDPMGFTVNMSEMCKFPQNKILQ